MLVLCVVVAVVAAGVAAVSALVSRQGPDPGPAGGRGVAAAPTPVAPAERAFPDAGTTGVPDGVELIPSGGFAVREDGALIEDLLVVDGAIEVYADDVTIRNVRVTNQEQMLYWGVAQRRGFSGLVVENSEIFGNRESSEKISAGIYNHGGMITVRRVEIHSVTDAIMTSHGLIEDSYLHSPRYFDGDHTDMIQAVGGSREGLPLEIRNNTIINTENQTSAVFLSDEAGGGQQVPVQNVLVEHNLLAGGGYTLYGGGLVADGRDPRDIVIRDNVFSRQVWPDGGYWGPVTYFDPAAPGNEWSGNVWDDGSPMRPG